MFTFVPNLSPLSCKVAINRIGVTQRAMDELGAVSGSRSQPQPQPGTCPADRISSLPDDLLLQVLSHLGYPSAAARTTLLSRRWRGLCSKLPSIDVTLRDVPLRFLEDALRRAARAGLRHLDIDVPAHDCPSAADGLSPGQIRFLHIRDPFDEDGGAVVAAASTVSSVLREAASLSPVQLRFALPSTLTTSPGVAVDLPCFPRATSIDLRAPPRLELTHTQASAGFPALERLSLSGYHLDLEALIPRCPRLRLLSLAAGAPGGAHFTVQSFSVQELVVDRTLIPTRSIVVQAPMLEQLTMSFYANRELSVAIVAPMVQKVSWRCSYSCLAHGLGLWDLMEVSLETTQGIRHSATDCSNIDDTGEDVCLQLPHINVLSLRMSSARGSLDFLNGETRFMVEISKHIVTDFSRLELHLGTSGHSFGSFVWRVLGMHQIRNATQRLKLVLLKSKVRVPCRAHCPCDGPWNWRTQPVYLPNLQKLGIEGFEGEDQEFDFLKLVLRRAPMLKRVTVRMPDQVTPNGDWCTKLHDIFAAYPKVECSVDIIP